MTGNGQPKNMKSKTPGFIVAALVVIPGAIIYSLFPLIPFWFMAPAGPGDNNQANVKN